MKPKTTHVQTVEVLVAFMKFRFQEAGFDGGKSDCIRGLYDMIKHDDIQAVKHTNRFYQYLINHDDTRSEICKMVSRITIGSKANPQNIAYNEVNNLYNSLFCDDKINWGRIAYVVILCSVICVRCMECDNGIGVYLMIDSTNKFFRENKINNWIYEKGGWEVMPDFFGVHKGRQRKMKSSCSKWAALAGLLALGLGGYFIWCKSQQLHNSDKPLSATELLLCALEPKIAGKIPTDCPCLQLPKFDCGP